MRQLELFPITLAIDRNVYNPHEKSHFIADISASQRFYFDTHCLPYVYAGITYEDIRTIDMKKSKRFNSSIQFINIRLGKLEKEAFEVWYKENLKNLFKMVNTLHEEGYKISLSPDFQNNCIIASITGTDNASFNNGLCFTSRAEVVEEAIMLMCYKHIVMAHSESWEDIAESRDDAWG